MKMKKHVPTSMALGFLIFFATFAVAADTKKPAARKTTAKSAQKTEKPTEKSTEKPVVKSPTKRSAKTKSKQSTRQSTSVSKGRLPRYFGKLDLDDHQRERVYELQAEYDAKIANLLAEIQKLKTSRSSLCQKILKPSQREKFKELSAAAKKSPPSKKSTAKVASKRGAAKKTSGGGRR